jgi:nitroreductase
MTQASRTIPLPRHSSYSAAEMRERAEAFYDEVRLRRTVRDFSPEPVAREVIEACLLAAGTAPNGANHQPWHFVAVSDLDTKRRIRESAEEEERAFYGGRAPDDWLEALAPLGTNADKPFLETAPWLIAIFAESWHLDADGAKRKNYYVTESVGIATGILITALHRSGLVTLTHTPSPMKFLNGVLGRPDRERPFLLLVVGHPADGVEVPDIDKKSLSQISTFV